MSPVRRVPSDVSFEEIRAQLKVPTRFPADVLDEAARVALSPSLPDEDATGLPLVTLDPPGSKDLDQALHIVARDGGYRVTYAIADVAAFVTPDGALDHECWRRGSTLYSPDLRTPLHPPALSEGAASLLPDQVRPAVLWELDLDSTGVVTAASVRRARVRSVAQLDYPTTQADIDAGRAHPSISLLPEVGRLRLQLAQERGAVELDLPDQEVERTDAGTWTTVYREQQSCEKWNAEISLMTGIEAARIMLEGRVGILRTLPPPTKGAVAELRATAKILGVPWPDGDTPGAVIASVRRDDPRHVAFLQQSAHLLRGAGYSAFDGAPPDQPLHAGVGSSYAHATAPLRRLVDRYVSEVCLALTAGVAVPGWARSALPRLPEIMAEAAGRESRLDSAVVDTVEAMLLVDRGTEVFDGVAVSVGEGRATVVLDEPAVRAQAQGDGVALGDRVRVKVLEADPKRHLVRLVLVP